MKRLPAFSMSDHADGNSPRGTKRKKLALIKTIHTAIWLFFNLVLFYLYYAALSNHITVWVWISLCLFGLEGIVLVLFKNSCPLTLIARRYSHSSKDNFDIYLPNWLARNNKRIYIALLFIVVIILLYRIFSK